MVSRTTDEGFRNEYEPDLTNHFQRLIGWDGTLLVQVRKKADQYGRVAREAGTFDLPTIDPHSGEHTP